LSASASEGESKAKGGGGSLRVVIAALLINLAIAAFKFVAAFFSRSSAMLAEACHSLADTANQIFLLIGMRRSARPPDEEHPFGYGPETYFWAFMVALSIFSLGGGFSIREGIHKIMHRHEPGQEIDDPRWAYVVLGMSILLETYSLLVAMREFKHIRGGRTLRRTLAEARDPTVLTIMFEDIAALFGLGVAFAGVFLSRVTGNVVWDGAASIVVGVALGGVAWVLARDAKSLLIGEGVTAADAVKIREIVKRHRDVVDVIHLRTMYLGPDEALLAIKVRFIGNLDIRTLEKSINDIEAELRAALPKLRRIYVEPGFDERGSRAGAGGAGEAR
jgi:cation diffusion facilitator family transporter